MPEIEKRGVLAHFEFEPGQTSRADVHATVEEIWYFLNDRGEMKRKLGDHKEVLAVEQGSCITIPVGTHFQFHSFGYEQLSAIGVTMPPWPGEGELHEVKGKRKPNVKSKTP